MRKRPVQLSLSSRGAAQTLTPARPAPARLPPLSQRTRRRAAARRAPGPRPPAAVQMAGVSEALALGSALGLDPKALSQVMSGSSARCWSLDSYSPVPVSPRARASAPPRRAPIPPRRRLGAPDPASAPPRRAPIPPRRRVDAPRSRLGAAEPARRGRCCGARGCMKVWPGARGITAPAGAAAGAGSRKRGCGEPQKWHRRVVCVASNLAPFPIGRFHP
jgi:hypothetical protein